MPSSTHRLAQSPHPSPRTTLLSPPTISPSPQPSITPEPPNLEPTDPPPFTPLFTLLTTHPSPTTHQPKVHYLFSDDDHSLLTSAALSTLEPASPASPSPTSLSPPTAAPPAKEHLLLIDLDESGSKVVNAQSMSPEWAITDAEIGKAPTWSGEEEQEEGGGLMLRIEGVEASRGDGEEGEEVGVQELEGLVERFRRGMEGLRRVVEAGERWGAVAVVEEGEG